MTEWRWVPGFKNYYKVSSDGDIWSMTRTVWARPEVTRQVRGRFLVQSIAGNGYYVVTLSKEGIQSNHLVHHLVTAAFLGPRPAGLVTRHLDGNPFNNKISNLAHGTYAENAADTVAHGKNYFSNLTQCPRGHDLVPGNLVDRPQGRACLACNRARSYQKFQIKYGKPFYPDIKKLSDEYYEKTIRTQEMVTISV